MRQKNLYVLIMIFAFALSVITAQEKVGFCVYLPSDFIVATDNQSETHQRHSRNERAAYMESHINEYIANAFSKVFIENAYKVKRLPPSDYDNAGENADVDYIVFVSCSNRGTRNSNSLKVQATVQEKQSKEIIMVYETPQKVPYNILKFGNKYAEDFLKHFNAVVRL